MKNIMVFDMNDTGSQPELSEGVFQFRIKAITLEENVLTAYGMSERITILFYNNSLG